MVQEMRVFKSYPATARPCLLSSPRTAGQEGAAVGHPRRAPPAAAPPPPARAPEVF